jgi:hypothetical protein
MTTISGAAIRPIRLTLPATLLWTYGLGLAVALATYAAWTPESSPLVIPLAVLIVAAMVFFSTLVLRQGGGAPVFEIGGFFGMMIVLYAAYPAVVYLVRGMRYGEESDGRLWLAEAAPAQLGTLEWWYVAFFITFAVVYLAVTHRTATTRLVVTPPLRGVVIVVVAGYCVATSVIWLIRRLFPYEVHTYGDSFLATQQLPTLVRQVMGTSMQSIPTLVIMMLVALFTQYRRRRIWIALLIVWICYTTLRAMQARVLVFLTLYVAAFLYHHLVRRISLKVAVAGVVVALTGLSWLGAVRRTGSDVGAREALTGSSEFEVILANAYDLKYVQGGNGVLLDRPLVYLSDLTAVVPQQFLPFTKLMKSEWYVGTYWPEIAAKGGGLAFGVLAEAVTGFGTVEIFLRAALVAVVFGLMQRRIASRPASLWLLTAYLWLTVWSYQILRTTTFHLVQWAEYQLLIPIIAVWVIYLILSRSKQRLRRAFRTV